MIGLEWLVALDLVVLLEVLGQELVEALDLEGLEDSFQVAT